MHTKWFYTFYYLIFKTGFHVQTHLLICIVVKGINKDYFIVKKLVWNVGINALSGIRIVLLSKDWFKNWKIWTAALPVWTHKWHVRVVLFMINHLLKIIKRKQWMRKKIILRIKDIDRWNLEVEWMNHKLPPFVH